MTREEETNERNACDEWFHEKGGASIQDAWCEGARRAPDAARLDFMVRTGAVVQWYGETCQLHGSQGVMSGKREFYESAREAIDAAMKKEGA
ncbi:hypothetical protein [Caballeronia sp. S22]|uniref:hypothetical protein n=1 Tax=Caballeronia sp. S22 TaxID=3137182 RepID=UPI00353128C6